jgi:hypothetical protein
MEPVRRFFNKAKKELTIGFHESLRLTGLREDTDDPDYAVRAAILDQIEAQTNQILDSLASYSSDIQTAAVASDSAYSLLKDPGSPPSAVLTLTYRHAAEELQDRCVAPLNHLKVRVTGLRDIERKRKRNRTLITGEEGPENEMRTAKYLQYHRAFLTGVDCLAGLTTNVFERILALQRFCLREYVRALKEDLEGRQPVSESPQLDIPPVVAASSGQAEAGEARPSSGAPAGVEEEEEEPRG